MNESAVEPKGALKRRDMSACSLATQLEVQYRCAIHTGPVWFPSPRRPPWVTSLIYTQAQRWAKMDIEFEGTLPQKQQKVALGNWGYTKNKNNSQHDNTFLSG